MMVISKEEPNKVMMPRAMPIVVKVSMYLKMIWCDHQLKV